MSNELRRVSGENALMRHGTGHSAGVLPLALAPLGRSDSVRMTALSRVSFAAYGARIYFC